MFCFTLPLRSLLDLALPPALEILPADQPPDTRESWHLAPAKGCAVRYRLRLGQFLQVHRQIALPPFSGRQAQPTINRITDPFVHRGVGRFHGGLRRERSGATFFRSAPLLGALDGAWLWRLPSRIGGLD